VTVDPQTDDWFVCPNCGEVLIGDPTSCSRCGADDETGLSGSTPDGLDLPDDEFDYDEFIAEEFGGRPRRSQTALWFLIGLALALIAVLMMLI
jgi:hypothetical protein